MSFPALKSRRNRNQRPLRTAVRRKHRSLRFDPLEERAMLSLGAITPLYPQFTYDSTGHVAYTPSSDQFSLTATPLTFATSPSSSSRVTSASLSIGIHVDNSGNLVAQPGDGLTVNGTVTVSGTRYTGTLLTGNIAEFGDTNGPAGSDLTTYYFAFVPTGGSMESYFGNQYIGFLSNSENSTFVSWEQSFTGGTKGSIGPLGEPSISTATVGTVVLGSGTPLTDSATLASGYSPTGTITFTLSDGNGNTLDTETAPVNGDGTYTTPTGYLPTATGTYQWVASYSGDSGNASIASSLGAEPETVSPATPTIDTLASAGSVAVGDAISDVATVSGGYSPTGTVTFNLYDNPDGTGTPLFTDANEPLSGGVAASNDYTTTATGSDYWVATYNGDAATLASAAASPRSR